MQTAILKFGSLFSGVGGLDLGLERAGFECAWQVEADAYCRDVLERHWPQVPRFGDVRDVGAACLAPVELLAGGFPCQDVSSAGRRAGIGDGTRSGLWSEFARLIGELRPHYVLIENVEALRHRGRGFDRVLSDLSALRFDATWDCVPACAFGAAHRRERLFVFAWAATAPHAGRLGRLDADGASLFAGFARPQFPAWQPEEHLECFEVCGTSYRALPRHLRTPDGLSIGLDAAHIKPHERRILTRAVEDGTHRIKACGNAVAPPVAEWVGRCLAHWLAPNFSPHHGTLSR